MEYNTTTLVASKHHGRKVVLNHSIQSPRAKLKEQVENSGYGYPGILIDLSLSSSILYWHNEEKQGSILP